MLSDDIGNLISLYFYSLLTGFDKLKGIQFMLRGMSQGDLNYYFCQTHIHGNQTHYYALEVYDDHPLQVFISRKYLHKKGCGF